jgi:hypothetical protein
VLSARRERNLVLKKFEIKTRLDFAKVICFVQRDLLNYVNGGKFEPFDVTIERHVEKKTGGQLRGFFRLCQHIAPYLQEMTGEVWDKDRVRYYITMRSGYVDLYKGIVTPRSLAKAQKEEMMTLINLLIVFGNEMDIPDCTLTSKEEEAFNNYYGVEK